MPALPPDLSRPPVLDAICARALAINPDERYATAAELEVDLQPCWSAPPIRTRARSGAWSRMLRGARAPSVRR